MLESQFVTWKGSHYDGGRGPFDLRSTRVKLRIKTYSRTYKGEEESYFIVSPIDFPEES